MSTGRRGGQYSYWLCLGRHKYKNGCDLPYLAEEKVEQVLAQHWESERLDETEAAEIRRGLLADLKDYATAADAQRAHLAERIHAIRRDRFKWAEKAMDESVPRDIAKAKQQELAGQLAHAEAQLSRLDVTHASHEALILAITKIAAGCAQAYAQGDDTTCRLYNQAWFDGL